MINKFIDFYINQAFKKRSWKKIILIVLLLELLLFILRIGILFVIGNNNFFQAPDSGILTLKYLNLNLVSYTPFIFLAAVLEELVFTLPIYFFILKKFSHRIKFYLILTSAVVFGASHVDFLNIFRLMDTFIPLTISALITSFIFIMSGANKGKLLIPFLLVVLTHTLWNLFVPALLGSDPALFLVG